MLKAFLIAVFLLVPTSSIAQSQHGIPNSTSQNTHADGNANRARQKQDSEKQTFVTQTQSTQPRQLKSQQEGGDETADTEETVNILLGIAQTGALVVTFWVMAYVGIKQLRAYVYATPDYLFFFDATVYPAIRFRIYNSGVTPAYNLKHRAQIGILNHPYKAGMVMEPISGEWSAPLSVHKGGAPFFLVHKKSRLFTKDEITKLQTGAARLYIYGEIKYRDAFRFPRYTQFCHWVDVEPAVMKKITSNFNGKVKEIRFPLTPFANRAT